MKAQLVIGLSAALALAACNNKSNDQDDHTLAANQPPAPPATPSPSESPTTTTAPTTPQGFVDTAASSDMYEIAAGKLAEQQGKSSDVKAFAAMMVKDHTKSSADLKAAVAKAGNGLMVPSAMQPPQQQQLDELKKAGGNFDMIYAQQQVGAHQAALMLLTDQANSGTVPELKDFAIKTKPVVQHHLDEAMKLP